MRLLCQFGLGGGLHAGQHLGLVIGLPERLFRRSVGVVFVMLGRPIAGFCGAACCLAHDVFLMIVEPLTRGAR